MPLNIGKPEENENLPGADQTITTELLELTNPIETQTVFNGFCGGLASHPVGGVPVLVVKSHEPPVGVAGKVSET